METDRRLRLVLFLLRISVFVVMLVWTLDKFILPGHTAKVFGKFYLLPGLEAPIIYAIGIVQLIVIVSFVIGFQKTISSGLILAMHTVSTLASYPQYINVYQPKTSLLFWAAWPMLAACFALFYLRDLDTMASMDKS